VVAAAILFSAGSASAAETLRKGEDVLLDTYQRIMVRLKKTSFGFPLYLESFERDDKVRIRTWCRSSSELKQSLNKLNK